MIWTLRCGWSPETNISCGGFPIFSLLHHYLQSIAGKLSFESSLCHSVSMPPLGLPVIFRDHAHSVSCKNTGLPSQPLDYIVLKITFRPCKLSTPIWRWELSRFVLSSSEQANPAVTFSSFFYLFLAWKRRFFWFAGKISNEYVIVQIFFISCVSKRLRLCSSLQWHVNGTCSLTGKGRLRQDGGANFICTDNLETENLKRPLPCNVPCTQK